MAHNLSLKDIAAQLTIEEATELVARVLAAQDHRTINEYKDATDPEVVSLRNDLIEDYAYPYSVMTDNFNNQEVVSMIDDAMQRVAPEYKLPQS